MLLDHVAVAVQLLIHHVGLVEVSAVDAGGLGGDELERGDVEVLAKGVAGQIQGGERLPGGEDAPHVPLEVHACLVHQAEVLHVVVEPVGPHGQADADKGRVAGVPHRLLEHLMPVAAVVGTADGVVADGHGAAAVKGAAGVHRPLLQGHGQGEDLGRGAGLVGVVHRLVAPLLQLQLPQLLPVGVGVLLVRGGGILLVHLGQLLLEFAVIDLPVGVHVVGGAGGDGQDGPALGVHNHPRGPVLGPVFGDHVLQAPLHVVLDGAVQGQLEAVAVLGVVVLLILEHDLRAVAVLGRDGQARAALQLLIVQGLQAVGPVVVGVQKPDDMGGQGAVGVVALGVGLQVDPLDAGAGVVGGDELPHLVPHGLLHPPLEDLVGGVGLAHLVPDRLLVQLQNPGQIHGNQVPVFLAADRELLPLLHPCHHGLGPGCLQLGGPALNGPGVQEHGVRGGGHGQNGAVPVQNGAPGGGDHRAAHLLVGGPLLHLVVLVDGQIVGLGEEGQKGRHAEHQHQRQSAPLDHQLGQAGGLHDFSLFSAGTLLLLGIF